MTPNATSHRSGGSKGRRVLVVEDDTDLADEMVSLLECAGYCVDRCENGKAALDFLQRSPVDVIILDLMMPVMDGWEFVTAKRRDPSISHIPVVAVSADNSPRASAVGAEVYLPKPFDGNDLIGTVGRVILDADRRQLAQRLDQTERLVLLGTIAAGVGHEINNPLTMTAANLDLMNRGLSALLETVRGKEQSGKHGFGELEQALGRLQKQLDDSRSGIDRIRIIVRDLHRVSRPPSEERTRIDVLSLLESVIAMASREIEPRAEVVRSYEPEVRVHGNEARLGQVFLNLLVNAAQSISSDRTDPQRIHVACRRDGTFAIVEVRDTGNGMTPSQKERIFEPFFTTKGQMGGTGLGLAICKEIVERHGGVIDVRSELGQGSAFTVRLPLDGGE